MLQDATPTQTPVGSQPQSTKTAAPATAPATAPAAAQAALTPASNVSASRKAYQRKRRQAQLATVKQVMAQQKGHTITQTDHPQAVAHLPGHMTNLSPAAAPMTHLEASPAPAAEAAAAPWTKAAAATPAAAAFGMHANGANALEQQTPAGNSQSMQHAIPGIHASNSEASSAEA